MPRPQSPLSSISSQVLEGPTSDFRTQTGPLCSVPPTLQALQQTPPRNSPSRSFCSCVLPNTPSGAQFHHVFMKTSAKHRLRVPMPPRSFLLLSSWRVAISQVLSHRVPIPAPPHFWRQQRRLPHTVLLMLMRPPNSRFFLGCIDSKDPLDRSGPSLAHGNVCTTCSRPIPTLLLDAAAQTPPHRVATAEATTQLPLTEFFLGCVYSKDPLDRSVPPPAHGPAHSVSLLQPSDIATINSLSSTSSSSGPHPCTQVSRARLYSAPPPPLSLEDQAPLISSS